MRVYPKDHSRKKWKMVSYSAIYGTRVSYFRTYLMARFNAFMDYHTSEYMKSVDIIDQEGDDGDV